MLFLAVWIFIQLPPAQNWMAHYAASEFSERLKTKVEVRNVSFTLFNHVNLEGVYIEDLHHDTLLCAGEMSLNITDWFFWEKDIDIKYVGLKDAVIYPKRTTDSIWNYQFMLDYFASDDTTKTKEPVDATIKKIAIHLKHLDFENVIFESRDKYHGNTTVLQLGKLDLSANNIDFHNQLFDIAELHLKSPTYATSTYKGLWSYEDSVRWRQQIDASSSNGNFPANPANIQLHINKCAIENGLLELKSRTAKAPIQGEFNAKDITFANITGTFDDIHWNHDTITAKMDFSAKEREGLAIKRCKTDFTFHPQMMECSNLDLQLNESRLTNYYCMQFNSMDDFKDFETKVKLTSDFKNTIISTDDISFFAPNLKNKKQKIIVNGYVSGTLNDLFTKDIKLRTDGSDISGSLRVSGLPNADNMLIDFSTTGSTIQFNDVATWAPTINNFSNGLKQGLKAVRFKGSFKGFTNDFAVKGDIITNDGALRTDLKMKLGINKNIYDAAIITTDLHLGKLLGIADLGKINFDGTLTGQGFDVNTTKMQFNGNLNSTFYHNYNYRNIKIKGALNGTLLNAHLDANDPNLEGVLDAVIDLKAKKQSYITNGYLTKANFQPLHFAENDIKFTGMFDVNFSGKNVDDFLGYAKLRNAHLTNGDMPFKLDSLHIYSQINTEGKKELEIQTNEIDASVVGKFNIADLSNSFQYFFSNYYPAIINKPKLITKNQDFIFAINTKEIEAFLKLFNNKIEGLSNSNIIGTINTNDDQLMINASIPYFKYENFQLDNANIIGNGSLHKLDILGTVSTFRFSDSLSFYNAKLNVATENDISQLKITTNSDGQLGEAEIDATVITGNERLKLRFNPSTFILNNRKWAISQDGEVILKNNKQFVIDNLSLKQGEQEINVFTMPSSETNSNDIHIDTKKINMGDILPYVLKSPRIEGIATGKFVISDAMGKSNISINSLQVNEFRLDGDSIGVMNLKGHFIAATGKGTFNVESPNKRYNFDGLIELDLHDSTGNQINAPMNFNHTRIDILNNYLGTLFDDIDGYASGKLLIKGKFNEPELVGDVHIDSVRIKVGYTKVAYFIDSGTINMREGYMGFGKMKLRDRYNNYGTLEGGFNHHFFKEMSFGLKVNSSRMELIHTTFKDNQTFYGNAIGKGSFELNGPVNNLIMKIGAEPTDSSHISITSTASRESGEADYIIFKKYGREQTPPKTNENNLYVEVDLKTNNKAQIDVILDAVNGDVIKAWGNGRLKIINDKNGMTMKGRYDIERGNYNYSFQSFIRKGFDLKGDGNNYIEWATGDPMGATLNIDAIYPAKNVRFSDLNGSSNRFSLTKSTANYKGDINVIAALRGKLAKPDIGFKLDFPAGSTIKNDPSATIIIDGINNNQDRSELLKQVTYLIIFNQFAPYGEGKGSRNPTADLAVNTVSELLSREMGKILSNVLYQITGDRSIQVDFSTSVYNSADLSNGNVNATNGYDRTRLNFKIGKSFANNRIIINVGSDFDFSVRNSAVNTFQFLPDISVEFILSANRKLRAILFKKDNLELGTRQNRAGASISFRQDLEKLFGKNTDTIKITGASSN